MKLCEARISAFILAALFAVGLISTALAQAKQPAKMAAEKVKILVVYHSRGGYTAAMAKAVAEGAKKNPQAEVSIKTVGEVKCAELLATDALIVGSPVYWSNMAGEVKSFFDRWSTECNVLPPAFPMRDKVGGAFVTGGEISSGKEIALMTMVAAMLGNRMIVVSEGQALGAAATTGEGKSPLTEKELDEARRLGERVTQTAATLKRGKGK
ncbi:MAG: flavodoxin family protein [Acidobacteriota bacterium]|nr:flavodoxin family protein [Acidobacteriota bacterium]